MLFAIKTSLTGWWLV